MHFSQDFKLIFRKLSGNIHGILREFSWNVQGMFRECSGKFNGILREFSWIILNTSNYKVVNRNKKYL